MASTVAPYNNLNYSFVSVLPGEHIVRRSYNGSNQILYFGYAPRGSSEDGSVWCIRKYTYSSNLITEENVAVGVDWTNRTSHTYA